MKEMVSLLYENPKHSFDCHTLLGALQFEPWLKALAMEVAELVEIDD